MAAPSAPTSADGTQDSRPNIILITTDQQRYDTLGVTGNPHVSTPALDALARRGTLFERAYIQNPVCVPSRACIQTGRYVHQHGVEHMSSVIGDTPASHRGRRPSWNACATAATPPRHSARST